MTAVRHIKAEITLNKMTKHTVTVPEWELPVLQAQWGASVDLATADEVMLERKLPDPNDEFVRLAQRYGPKHEDTPYVAGVYGNFGPGINALRDAIVRSTQPRVEIVEEPEPAAGGPAPGGLGLDEGGDPDDYADLTGDAA